MLPTASGSFRLFRLFGIDVYLHWSWLLVAVIEVQTMHRYQQAFWAWAEYIALFGIVLMHEFGHALACRSVGGQANRIVLWPLGGVAYVSPPLRPGPFLWSIAAGPLVNVLLVPVTLLALFLQNNWAAGYAAGDLHRCLYMIAAINGGLLVFNILPIYPLDGGQIFQSILWFFIGFVQSLRITAIIGLIVAVVGGGLMLLAQDYWLVVMAIFIGWRAWNGFQLAQRIAVLEADAAARHAPIMQHTQSRDANS